MEQNLDMGFVRHAENLDEWQLPTDGVAIPRMDTDQKLLFHPWYCHAIRGSKVASSLFPNLLAKTTLTDFPEQSPFFSEIGGEGGRQAG